jgi:Tfp pilus assembly protein PilW
VLIKAERLRATRRRQQGLSLVELMVGIVVGMFVVAAASMLVAGQLADNRRMLLEVQVQQDLRAAADIITRELRRAGSWGDTAATGDGAQDGISRDGMNPLSNPLLTVSPNNTGPVTSVSYSSSRAGSGSTGPYGFRLNGGVIQSQLDPSSGWQSLTDESTMFVETFNITGVNEPAVRVPCPKRCSDGTTNCWPTVTVRRFEIAITGRSVSDSKVRRSVSSVVRLRNDQVRFNDAANPTLACPA